jgi:Na+-driven multidrug efflux pump
MEYSEILGVEECGRLLLKFSVPAIIGMMMNAAYNIIDRIFVSRIVGILGILTVTVAALLFTITLAICLTAVGLKFRGPLLILLGASSKVLPVEGISQGVQAIISNNYGARKFRKIDGQYRLSSPIGSHGTLKAGA